MLNIKAFQFNMFGVNTYVVWDPVTLDAAIIDPGMINRSEERGVGKEGRSRWPPYH